MNRCEPAGWANKGATLAAFLLILSMELESAAVQSSFSDDLTNIRLGLAADAEVLSSGASLELHWSENHLLYQPQPGRFTVDRVDLRTGDQERLVHHASVASLVPGACELLTSQPAADQLAFLCDEDLHLLNLVSGEVRRVAGGGETERLKQPQMISDQLPTTFGPLIEAASPDGKWFVTVRDHNLFLRDADGKLEQLTDDGTPRETWWNTQESAQHFNVFWSADSESVAAIQLDTRQVWHEPTAQLLDTPPRTVPIAYPRAGEAIHGFRLYIIDAHTGERVRVQAGDTRDQYVDIIGWQGDDKGLLYQVVDRQHKVRRIYRADRASGSTTLLLQESTDTYHDTWMTLFIDFVVPLKDGNGFLYLSERSGWRHIERYDGQGSLQATITRGDWAVNEIVHIDEEAGFVYFTSALKPAEPYARQLYRSPLDGSAAPTLLSSGAGSVTVRPSPDGQFFVLRQSSPDEPPVVELRRADGHLLREISRFDTKQLEESGFGGMETVLVDARSSGWSIPVTIFRPLDFDPDTSYPVIEHIYGGMQAIHTRHQFYGFDDGAVDEVTQTLLRAGYVVVRVDAPGTPGRGKRFQDVRYGRWPQGVIAHHVAAIQSVAKTRPWMDLRRVGIYGHSWGAYMAQRAMIDGNGFYLAAAAHNGGSDFYDQPTYIEPFMGLPTSNPEGYRRASNLDRVHEIRGPILSFTGPHDVNSGFSPAFKLMDKMIAAGKDIEIVPTPRSHHRMRCCGDPETLFKLTKIKRFFDREVRAASLSRENLE